MPIQFRVMAECYECYGIMIPHRVMSTTQYAKSVVFQNS